MTPDFVDDKGVGFYVSMTSDGLCIHATAPEGWRIGSMDYDPNCGNEGWIKVKLAPAITPRPLKPKNAA